MDSEKECCRKSNDGDNVIYIVKPVQSEKQCDRKSSDRDNVVSIVQPVESEPIPDNAIQQELSRIMHAVASLREMHTAAYETMNKKLDVLVMKQKNIDEKLNALAMVIGVDINDLC